MRSGTSRGVIERAAQGPRGRPGRTAPRLRASPGKAPDRASPHVSGRAAVDARGRRRAARHRRVQFFLFRHARPRGRGGSPRDDGHVGLLSRTGARSRTKTTSLRPSRAVTRAVDAGDDARGDGLPEPPVPVLHRTRRRAGKGALSAPTTATTASSSRLIIAETAAFDPFSLLWLFFILASLQPESRARCCSLSGGGRCTRSRAGVARP